MAKSLFRTQIPRVLPVNEAEETNSPKAKPEDTTGFASGSLSIPPKLTLNAILKKHHLRLLLLHGSRVRGLTHSKSDVDIAILRLPASKFSLLALISDLSQAFATDRIDVVDLTHADPLLLYAVTTHAQLLAGKQSDLHKLNLRAFHCYCDYLPYLAMEQRLVSEKFSSYVTP